MKVYLDKLEYFHLYKDKQLLLGNSENKLKSNVIITNVLDNSEFENTFKSNIFVNKFIKGYFIPRNDLSVICRNKKIHNFQKEAYVKIKTDYPSIRYLKNKLANYNDYNTYYDMSSYLSLFLSTFENYTLIRRVNLFQDLLKEILHKVNSYQNIFIHIIPSKEIISGREFSLENIIYFLSKNNLLDKEICDRVNFIISDNKSKLMFKVKVSNKDDDFDLVKFKRYCNLIYKRNLNLQLTNEEINDLETNTSEENINNEIANKENIKKELKSTIKKNVNLPNDKLTKVYEKIDKEVDNSDENINKNDIKMSLNNDTEFKKEVNNARNENITKNDKEEIDKIISNKLPISRNSSEIDSSENKTTSKNATHYTNTEKSSTNQSDNINNSDTSENNKNSGISSDIDKDYQNSLNGTSDTIYKYKNYDDTEEIDDYFSGFDDNKNNQETQIDKKQLSKIQEKQSKVTVKVKDKEVSLDSIKEEKEVDDIDIQEIKVNTLNTEVKKSTLKDLDRSYVQLQKDKDMYKILTSFNEDPECPIYVTDIKRENSSTSFDKKETLTITFEDTNKKKHTVKIDVPLIIDNNFMYLNNGKKSIAKQLNVLPIIKVSPDEVIITTNYSKTYISRFGRKINPNIDKLKKFILKDLPKDDKYFKIISGSNIGVNSKYDSTMEYDELSLSFIIISIKDFSINFNRADVDSYVEENTKFDIESNLKDNEFSLGYDKSTNTYFTIFKSDSSVKEYSMENKKLVKTYPSIFDLLLIKIKNYNESYYNKLISESISKKYMYSRISILQQKFPLIIMLGFYFGLEKVMERYKIDYEFLDKKKKQTDDEINNENLIVFNDGYLYYNSNLLRNNILMAGLNELNTKEISFTSLNNREAYYDIFDYLFGNRQMGKGLNNFLSLFLDPITKEVLSDLKLPTELLDIFLYSNTLLENNYYTNINDMHNYRVRSIEIINGELYKLLADAVKDYKDQYKNGRTEARISVRQNQLINNLMESQIVDSYSTLNPVLEIEKLGTTNYKGLSGTNKDNAFTIQMRAYDKSMVGLLGMSSPDSNKIGIVRFLSYDPCIKNTRGIIETPENVNDLDATNMFTAGELLNCYTSRHADPPQRGFNIEIYCRNLFNCWNSLILI